MSLILSGTDGLSDIDGTAATPAIRGTDTNTGIFFGSDIIGFSEGGAEVARFNADAQFVAAAGTASLPVITTTGDVNTGIFFPAADTIAFTEGGAESMRIDSSGNVGIGVTPSAWTTNFGFKALDIGQGCVLGATSDANLIFNGFFNASNNWIYKTTAEAARYQQSGSSHIWYGAASGTAGNTISFTERMRIDSSGDLLINSSTNVAGQIWIAVKAASRNAIEMAPTTNSSYSAMIFRANDNSSIGSIGCTTAATSYNTSSDYRLKENILPMTGALDKVQQLKPVTYTWKSTGEASQGFIAHELAEICPDAVSGEKDAVEAYTDKDGNEQTRIKPQGIDTSFLVATLTAAIQELKAIVDEQAARIAALENPPAPTPIES